jgi:branched-chain amino acid transport system ATP-binding protein
LVAAREAPGFNQTASDGGGVMAPLLETVNLCKYFGGLKAVHDVSMSVEKGSIHGIIGPNGAGKTTFFNMLTGNYFPTSGRVRYKGQDITNRAPEAVAKLGIARTFQNIRLFKNMTVLDNVKVGFHIKERTNLLDALLHTGRYQADEHDSVAKGLDLLERVNLAGLADEQAANLPYGFQRRLEIARALATDPDVLLLDEPAAGMNPLETKELMDFITRLAGEGLTILVIEHDMRLIMNISSVVTVLDHGEKICAGPPAYVQNSPAVIEAYLGAMGRVRRRVRKGGETSDPQS